ncbi:hypothetical protein [Haloferula sp. A504]|uniref:hypothetical protein n=1 Tax=Haloferula sp. A504 TaxID=3373601 RepID=UPI0031C904B2|nr:hypothetical protein [Verrucomicrobiaceae bacterium E54]
MKADDAPASVTLKPWWKSVAFWMGALVAGFLGWVWWDSMHMRSTLMVVCGSRVDSISTDSGCVAIELHDFRKSPPGMTMRRVSYERGTILRADPRTGVIEHGTPESWYWSRSTGDIINTMVMVFPLWFVFVAWGFSWFGCWELRRRRIRRKMAGLAGAVAETDREL